MAPALPHATYRLQLTKDFGFDAAAALVPYLRELGITHLYASPLFKARPGSTHGYDIVDFDQLNPELGGEDGFNRLSEALRRHDLGLIVDFVPNHMGVGRADNAWWLDVLEWGPKSPHAASFDIDWDALPHRRHPGVLLPILGRPYGEALHNGEIELKFDAASGSFAAWYFEHKLPINPQRYDEILRTLVAHAGAKNEPAGRTLITIADAYRAPNAPAYRDAPELKRELAAINGVAEIIERGLAAYRGDAGAAALHRLLERQNYRIAYWRVAFSAVNYRRFFDVNDLAGVRVENPATFRAMHGLVSRLIAEDRVQGLRIDHIDGLREPAQYTRRLRQLIHKARGRANMRGPFYVIVEKILGEGEPVPKLAGVAGTTGYEWLNVISRVLVDDSGLEPLEQTWRAFTGEQRPFAKMLDSAKRRVIDTILASEFTVLCSALSRIAAGHYSTRDYTIDRLRAALELYVLEFPVYRTYVTPAGASGEDRETINDAIGRARRRWQGPDPDVFDFLRDTITFDLAATPSYSAPRVRNFALKLQQFTGPLMAKSLEDTTFYRDHRLIALNEVGGQPTARGLSLDEFHAQQQQRAANAPAGLTATATHDTKRGEDARARILALSDLAGDWAAAVTEWQRLNAPFASFVDGRRQPSLGHEYMLYQALIGAWPGATGDDFIGRVQGYALKAAREGKQETSWTTPNEGYEAALNEFVAGLLDPNRSSAFLASFGAFAERAALLGALNGLSQLALKVLLPGVPDFYQGTELWDFSLVDPDNRRPVDFAVRTRALSEPRDWTALSQHWRDGGIKLELTRALLRLRHIFPDLLRHGEHAAIGVAGPYADHVIAFTRTLKREQLLIAIGRHSGLLTQGGRRWPQRWEGFIRGAPGARYRDALGDGAAHYSDEIGLDTLFAPLPIAVLRRE